MTKQEKLMASADQYANFRKYWKGWVAARVVTVRIWLDNYKRGLGCSTCGETDPRCLEFHHLDPMEKETNISWLVKHARSQAKIQKEIDKCVLLCANCHRKLHVPDFSQLQNGTNGSLPPV